MKAKEFIKSLTPPIIVRGYRTLCSTRNESSYGLTGDYLHWAEAVQASTGYDSEVILEKTKTALLKVKNGEVVHERDSVCYYEIHYSWPLLAGLMWVAARSHGNLSVLDFGGSLGSAYFQNRAFLSRIPDMRWSIVEQPGHVHVGKKYFEDDRLKFYASVEECMVDPAPNVIVLSGVLQYLEDPYSVMAKLLQLPANHVIIDRTPFWDGARDRLCVQHVPPHIYSASYPSWIFSKQRFASCLVKAWDTVAEFESLDKLKGPVELTYRGIIITRRGTELQPAHQSHCASKILRSSSASD